MIATSYEDERTRVYCRDKAFEADYKLLQKQLPGKDIDFGSSTTDERLWLVSAYSDVEPGETYLFDRKTKKLTLQYRIREKLPREHLAPMKAIRYKSSDGLEIPAYLTLPKGVAAKNLPLIVVPHGGPWARDSWGYNAAAVPGQPRLCRAAAELPRLDRLRQEVPQRRQQPVGRQDAGRHHLGRQVPGRRKASPIRSASASWADLTAVTRRWPASRSRLTFTRRRSRSSARRT